MKYGQTPLFNVMALITPDREAKRSNTLYRKSFKRIYESIDHDDYRWVIVNRMGETGYWAVDLWATDRISGFPYVEPMLLLGGPYATVEQAIGVVFLL